MSRQMNITWGYYINHYMLALIITSTYHSMSHYMLELRMNSTCLTHDDPLNTPELMMTITCMQFYHTNTYSTNKVYLLK